MAALRAGIALFALLWLSVGTGSRLRAEVLYSPLNGLVVAKQRALAIGCADHLKTIMFSAHTWAMDNCDTAPPDLAALT